MDHGDNSVLVDYDDDPLNNKFNEYKNFMSIFAGNGNDMTQEGIMNNNMFEESDPNADQNYKNISQFYKDTLLRANEEDTVNIEDTMHLEENKFCYDIDPWKNGGSGGNNLQSIQEEENEGEGDSNVGVVNGRAMI